MSSPPNRQRPLTNTRALFFGCSGPALTPEERAFFADVQPAGYILFARNCISPDQLAALCQELQALSTITSAPILIDQEGGRVARLRPPHWLAHPPAAPFGKLYERDPAAAKHAAFAHGAAVGGELSALGITVDCLPVLDVCLPGAHDIIGDRAYGSAPDVIADVGQSVMDGLISAGIVPVIKHIPGHGRALVDSHLELPVVEASRADLEALDFEPFRQCKSAPMAMTAHVLYPAMDAENCATHSSAIIQDIIRGYIGFDGLLMSDDLSMKALGGTLGARAAKAIAAGCDIALHCNGEMAEMMDIAEAVGPLSSMAETRLMAAMQIADPSRAVDIAQAAAARDAALSGLA